MKALFESIRAAARPGLWGKGVKLARDGLVLVLKRSPDMLELKVRDPARPAGSLVTLYPDDEESSCDCGSSFDPCEHVAAAVIAASQEQSSGNAIADVADREARLSYRFRKGPGRLLLDRIIVFPDGKETTLTDSLASLVARGPLPGMLSPREQDLQIDRILGSLRANDPLEPRLGTLLSALLTASEVRFDGAPVRPSATPIAPTALVRDDGNLTVLSIDAPAGLQVVGPGAGLLAGELRPLVDLDLAGPRFERLPFRRGYERGQLGELVSRVLPDIERRVELRIESKRLPSRGGRERARISFELSHEADGRLGVLPVLVYGDPPCARVDAGRLVQLGATVPKRDEGAERVVVERLRHELSLVPGRRVWFDGVEAARMVSRLDAWERSASDRPLIARRPLVPRLELDDDRFELSFELSPEEGEDGAEGAAVRTASAENVLRAFRQGLDVVALDGGGWAPLPGDWLARFAEPIADLLAAKGDKTSVPIAALPALAELCAALDRPAPPALDRLRPLFEGFTALPPLALPEGLEATLRVYQQDGVRWLSFLRDVGLGAVLADDMGLGKTLQTISVLRGRSLVVCPRSVMFNWERELARFRPGLRVAVYHGPKRELDPRADVTLTTYAVMRLDIDALATERFDTVVLDEAQAIKNEGSQVAQAAFRLDGAFRVSLSGTPVENRLEELWSQLHFTNPGVLGGLRDFKTRYADPISAGDTATAVRLAARVRPFVLRRLKREVAPELPPRTDLVLEVELDEDERNVYDAMRAATRKDVVERLSEGGNVLAALEALLRLRQAACHRSLLPGQRAEGSSKLARLLLSLEHAAADGHKALVFSQWTSLLDLLEPELQREQLGYLRLDGSTNDRQAVVEAFQAADGPPVLLLSLKAGGTGLNLTAADHVFLLDPWWNPAAEDQAADRAHRIGQDRPVFVHRLVAKDTVEEKMLALQERKRALADAALAGTASAALTREELLALLE